MFPDTVAALPFIALLERARSIAGSELNLNLPVDDLDSIRKSTSQLSAITYENPTAAANSRKNNAESHTPRENQLRLDRFALLRYV